MKNKITKEDLLKDISSLLSMADSDIYYESSDVAEKALAILSRTKEYLENETKNLSNP